MKTATLDQQAGQADKLHRIMLLCSVDEFKRELASSPVYRQWKFEDYERNFE